MSARSPVRRSIHIALSACAALSAAWAPARGNGEDAGVLVLRNGNILTGAVQRHGDGYRVDSATAQLYVPASQVELCCSSLSDAYEARRKNRVGESADGHLQLARWCMRNNLLDQAAREVLDARTIDAGHPGLAPIDAQLGHLLRLRAMHESASLPSQQSSTSDAIDAVASDPEPAPDLTEEARIQFVRHVQPMLVHGCTVGGCHQPGSRDKLQLDRWALEGNGNATLVRRNLASVVAQIDAADPASSPLIQWARQAHGGRAGKPSTPLAPYQAALLLEWLNAAGNSPDPVEAAPSDASPPGLATDEFATAGADFELENELEADLGPPSTSFAPRDAFDPEAFNRRYVTRKSSKLLAAGGAATSAPEVTGDDAKAVAEAIEPNDVTE